MMNDRKRASLDEAETVNLTRLDEATLARIAPAGESDANDERLRVNKAYKMFVGGAFVRSESGRYLQVKSQTRDTADPGVVNVPRGSRKDARDAVVAAKSAQEGWAARTAYNRGQILYRLAEVMESRRGELVDALVRGGAPLDEAEREMDCAIDRAVFYAGFCDKYQALLASSNPVSGPHFAFSVPEPMGVVAVVAPERPAVLGLISTVLPAIATGNAVVAIASEADPRAAIVLCECFATSDLPSGVVNVLTGEAREMAPHLAKHREVIALEAWSADPSLREQLERDASDNVKRVKTHAPMPIGSWLDPRRGQGLGWLERHVETKSVWHPVGL